MRITHNILVVEAEHEYDNEIEYKRHCHIMRNIGYEEAVKHVNQIGTITVFWRKESDIGCLPSL